MAEFLQQLQDLSAVLGLSPLGDESDLLGVDHLRDKHFLDVPDLSQLPKTLIGLLCAGLKLRKPTEDCYFGCSDVFSGKPSKASVDHVIRHFRPPKNLQLNDTDPTKAFWSQFKDGKDCNCIISETTESSNGWFLTFCMSQACQRRASSNHSQHYHCPRCGATAGKLKKLRQHEDYNCPYSPKAQKHREEKRRKNQLPPAPASMDVHQPQMPALNEPTFQETPITKGASTTFSIMVVDEKNGVFAAYRSCGRGYASHVFLKDADSSADAVNDGVEERLLTFGCTCQDEKVDDAANCSHIISVQAAQLDQLGAIRRAKPVRPMHPDVFGKGLLPNVRQKYRELFAYAEAKGTPVIAEITPTEERAFRRFSVLMHQGSLERVAVLAPTKKAVPSKENAQITCSNQKCKERHCIHVLTVVHTVAVETTECVPDSNQGGPSFFAATPDDEWSAFAFNLETTAEAWALLSDDFKQSLVPKSTDDSQQQKPDPKSSDDSQQRKPDPKSSNDSQQQKPDQKSSDDSQQQKPDPKATDDSHRDPKSTDPKKFGPEDYGKFWPKEDVSEESLPQHISLQHLPDVCRRCGSLLEKSREPNANEIIWVVGLNKAFQRRVVTKICSAPECRALYPWFGWDKGCHNIGNRVILSLSVVHNANLDLVYGTSLTSSVKKLAQRLKDLGIFQAAQVVEKDRFHIVQGILQFLCLAWAPSKEKKRRICPKCKDHPDFLVVDGTLKIIQEQVDMELMDDVDGQTTYSRAVNKAVWRGKENFVIIRPFAPQGLRRYPGLPNRGRGFSAAFLPFPAEEISDREAEKGKSSGQQNAPVVEGDEGAGDQLPRTTNDDMDKKVEEFLEQLITNPKKLTVKNIRQFMVDMKLKVPGSGATKDTLCTSALQQLTNLGYATLHVTNSLKKTSGGILLAICPHGIIYYFKFLRKLETVRDHVDVILSMLRRPFGYIGDQAPMVGKHYANCFPYSMMASRQGAVYPLTQENIDLAEKKALPRRSVYVEMKEAGMNEHNTDLFVCITDRFHQDNHKSDDSCLYHASLLVEMDGVSTQVCEQRNSVIKHFAPALTQWEPHAGQVLFAILVAQWNTAKIEKMKAMRLVTPVTLIRAPIGEGLRPDESMCPPEDECKHLASIARNVDKNNLPLSMLPTPWRALKRRDIVPLGATPPTIVLSATRESFPWEADELRLMHDLLPDLRDYSSGIISSVGPATLYDRSIPSNGRVVDNSTEPRTAIIAKLQAQIQQSCRGCYGALSIKTLPVSQDAPPRSGFLHDENHLFNQMFVVMDGYSERMPNRARNWVIREAGIKMFFHFRPKCLRLAFPKATFSFLVSSDVGILKDSGYRVVRFLADMQRIYGGDLPQN